MQTLRQSGKCFCQYQFWCRNVNVLRKNWNFGRNVDFSLSVHYYWMWLSFWKICLYLEKCDFFCEGLYTLTKFQILIKNFSFLGYVNLLENCYYDSKCHFVQWYFGQESHFLSKIYITLDINSWEKLSNFLRKVLI